MNQVMIIGNLARDPELRSAGETPVCTFTVAVQRGYKGPDGKAPVDFLPVVVWRALGENCAKYLAKGHKCAVVGEINVRSWQDQQGQKRYATEITARSVEFLGAPRGSQAAAPAPAPEAPAFTMADFGQMGFTQVDNDELPF